MFPIRIKACSESDLRMLGNLARNIQRVLPVTQADIDAAAALGKGWVVWKVVEVNDPIDNLRGGTQLVIKQNSITPGQNVRRVIFVSGPGGQTVVIRGTDYIVLPDAIAHSLSYVKAFGGTEQRNLPDGYTQLDGIVLDGSSYVDTGLTSFSNDGVYECDFVTSAAVDTRFVFGQNPSAGFLHVGFFTTASNLNWQYGAGSRLAPNASANTAFSIVAENGKLTTNGTATTGSASASITINQHLFVGAGVMPSSNLDSNTPDSRMFVGTINRFKYTLAGVVICDLVPVKRNSDNVLGFYDTARNTFLTNAGTGDFIAGGEAVPTPDTPIDIISNNGVLKARHQSGLPLGYTLLEYIESTGTQYINTGYFFTDVATETVTTDFMRTSASSTGSLIYGFRDSYKVNGYGIQVSNNGSTYMQYGAIDSGLGSTPTASMNTRYTITQTGPKYTFLGASYTSTGETPTQNYPLTVFAINNGGTPAASNMTMMRLYGMTIKDANNVVKMNLVPVKRSDNVLGVFDTVSGQFFTNAGTGTFTAGDPVSDPVEIYTDGTVETIGDTIGNTATAEMLLKVGDYQDVQEILAGAITRNVGVKVFDGTETGWVRGTNSIYIDGLFNDAIGYSADNPAITCSHFQGFPPSTTVSSMPDLSAKLGASNQPKRIYFVYDTMTTAAQFKQWLADQYAAGTPVIVIYPLATPTTESVAGQTLQVQAGDNTLEITQASLSNLELEAEYQKRT